MTSRYASFRPERYESELAAIIGALRERPEHDERRLNRILRRHPKDGSGLFSKSEIVRGFRHLKEKHGWEEDEGELVARIRMKPVRTASGVAPVTVLTKPHPCPGRCIFCPSDVRMPKSYLADEPGAQRAAQHRFDPYEQTLSRLRTYHFNGHLVDKVELIVLGGTWSFYPEDYRVWFVERCFAAMNDFAAAASERPRGGRSPERGRAPLPPGRPGIEWTYNARIGEIERQGSGAWVAGESAGREELAAAQEANETAPVRCVGLSLETRPDHLDAEEVRRLRRLGCTKVQIGYQSLSDEVLRLNRRGHDVAATRRAMRLLRGAGFKIHAHWMPNLHGSSPERDVEDFERIFADPAFRPDELKIYPCSLIESAELMERYRAGEWRPYERGELLEVLAACMAATPEYCRLTRVIRDIPGTDIVAGNRETNFRQVVEAELERRGVACRDIRAREIGRRPVELGGLTLERFDYATSIGREVFLQYVDSGRRLAAFLRLGLPREGVEIEEIRRSAMIREVHVYGVMAALGENGDGKAQHAGLGRRLVERAARIAADEGYPELAVISSVGTREYYRGLGFEDGELYQHLSRDGGLGRECPASDRSTASPTISPGPSAA